MIGRKKSHGQPLLQAAEYTVGDEDKAEQVVYGPCEGALLLTSPQTIAGIRAFARRAYEDYSLKAPKPSYLQALIRLNVLNAVSRNALALGIPVEGLCHDDMISPFNLPGPQLPTSPVMLGSSPKNLLATMLQTNAVHHPWIDLFPWPRVRDNILSALAINLFDEDELCCDILEIRNDEAGLIVWGEAWDVQSWEASEFFLRKWGYLTRGCPEILEATNYWREKRGARKLPFAPFPDCPSGADGSSGTHVGGQ